MFVKVQPAWQKGSRAEGNVSDQAGRHWVSIAKCTILPNSIVIGKSLLDVLL
jgi:hypothetical protein